MSNKPEEITIQINGNDFKFNGGINELNKYINEQDGKDKVTPAFNFISRCVNKDQKDELIKTVCVGGNVNGMIAVQIASILGEQLSGAVEVTLKK